MGRRAQSAPLAVVLVFAIVITGSTLVVVVGDEALTATQDTLDVERAANTMTQLDSQAAMVAIGDSKTQQVELESRSAEGFRVENESGWMNVSYVNTATRDVTTVYNESMGAIVYRSGDETIAYQGGGVWRERAGRSVMISPPEFHYRDATLTLPMVRVRGDQSVGGRATITHNSTTRYYPNRSVNAKFVNPLDGGKVNVTVGGPYYRAWGSYFEQRTDGQVAYQHDERRVTATLTVPVGDRKVKEAVQSSSSSGQINLEGSTSPGIDAYTSANGDGYDGEESGGHAWNNATLRTAGDVNFQDNAVEVYGNISAGGAVTMGNDWWSTVFYGDRVEYGTRIDYDPGPAVETEQISAVEGASQIDGPINERVSKIKGERDADDAISGDRITSSGTLGDEGPAGPKQFYVERIDLGSDETLTIDTSDGNVTIAVRDYVTLNDADIEVDGTHEVRFYIKGEASDSYGIPSGETFDANLRVVDGNVRTVGPGPSENSTQVWFYGKSDFEAAIYTGEVTGVIYAPGDHSSFGIRQADLYGGVVVNDAHVYQKGSIHYDKALENEQAVPEAARTTKVTYLHISVNRVNVTGR